MSSLQKYDYTPPSRLATFGARKSPHDPRDYIAEEVRAQDLAHARQTSKALPTTYDMRQHLLQVRHQGSRGTCVAFVGATIKTYQEVQETGTLQYFSPDFIYCNRPSQDKEGMFGREMLQVLLSLGCCTEFDMPYSPVDEPKKPSKAVYNRATLYRKAEKYKINLDGRGES